MLEAVGVVLEKNVREKLGETGGDRGLKLPRIFEMIARFGRDGRDWDFEGEESVIQ